MSDSWKPGQEKPAAPGRGAEVRAARRALGWSQTELARRAGVNIATVHATERQGRTWAAAEIDEALQRGREEQEGAAPTSTAASRRPSTTACDDGDPCTPVRAGATQPAGPASSTRPATTATPATSTDAARARPPKRVRADAVQRAEKRPDVAGPRRADNSLKPQTINVRRIERDVRVAGLQPPALRAALADLSTQPLKALVIVGLRQNGTRFREIELGTAHGQADLDAMVAGLRYAEQDLLTHYSEDVDDDG